MHLALLVENRDSVVGKFCKDQPATPNVNKNAICNKTQQLDIHHSRIERSEYLTRLRKGFASSSWGGSR